VTLPLASVTVDTLPALSNVVVTLWLKASVVTVARLSLSYDVAVVWPSASVTSVASPAAS
jgi:hypothetical protein